jgi:bifunctional polynucleotide phosphatase/kinase
MGYRLVVISNQAGISLKQTATAGRLTSFKLKVEAVVRQLAVPIRVYVATESDIFRKPRVGSWMEAIRDAGLAHEGADLDVSFFVGDAAGRQDMRDFSCTDRYAHSDFPAPTGMHTHNLMLTT